MTLPELIARVAAAERALRVARGRRIGIAKAIKAHMLAVAMYAAATPAKRAG